MRSPRVYLRPRQPLSCDDEAALLAAVAADEVPAQMEIVYGESRNLQNESSEIQRLLQRPTFYSTFSFPIGRRARAAAAKKM